MLVVGELRGYLCIKMPVIDKKRLLEEVDRLLDLGEPLLDTFPKEGLRRLKLPDGVSEAMRRYAYNVALRSWSSWQYWNGRKQRTGEYLVGLVEDLEVGLSGWREVGVIR